MKYPLLWVCMMGTCLFVNAQAPQAFTYQAVARDVDHQVLKNTTLGLRISVIDSNQIAVYSEIHEVTTSSIGLFTLHIGRGTTSTGDFTTIQWPEGHLSLKIEIDPEGGSDYIPLNTSPLLSVPYALFAENTLNVNDADADTLNEIQQLLIDGRTLSISGGNSITIPIIDSSGAVDSDTDPVNEIQDLFSSKVDSIITLDISGGGLSTTINIVDGDGDSNNEIQTINKAADTILLSNGGGFIIDAIDDADADPINEIQTLSRNGDTILLSANGGSFIDEIEDDDADATNEIQILEKLGSIVTLSRNGGSFVDAINDADADSTNEIQDLSLLTFANAGIDGMNVYRLKLTHSDEEVTLPITDLWKASILGGEEPSISSINTRFPVEITEDLDAPKINNNFLTSTDITIGTSPNLLTHLTPGVIQFENTSSGQGFKVTPEEISSIGISNSNRITLSSMTLSKQGNPAAVIDASENAEAGSISLYVPPVNIPFFTTHVDSFKSYLELNQGNQPLVQATSSAQNAGTIEVFGPNGNPNITLSNLSTDANKGYIRVKNQDGDARAGMYVRGDGMGEVFADNFNMVSPSPTNAQENIVYGSIHGPEVSVFERGTAQLQKGEAIIQFPRHFQQLISGQKMTVMITPLSAESKGIAVIEKTTKGFKVKELLKGKGTYSFDWEVKALRKGFEQHKVIVKKPLPHLKIDKE